MGLHEHKKIGLGVSLVAILGAVATAVGFYSDIESIFSKSDNNTKEVIVTSVVTQKETQAPLVEETTTELVTTTEEITEPPVTEPSVVYLADLEPVECENYEKIDTIKDTIGNIYTGKINCFMNYAFGSSAQVTYYLGGKYKTLSGTIAVGEGTDNGNAVALCIMADDTSIYATDEMERVSEPINFSIDVENAKWLKLEWTAREYLKSADMILYDWKLE